MAKDLPYFKFFVSEWNDGDITLEDFETQGLFINICAYYWSNECEITLSKTKKKFRHIDEDSFQNLIDSEVIKVEDDIITINFLDEQKEERIENSKKRSKGGRASAEARKLKRLTENQQKFNTSSTDVQQVLNSCSTETQVLREEERREEKKREEKKEIYSFEEFWNDYDKKTGRKNCEVKWKKIKDSDKLKIKETVKSYVSSKSDKKYIQNPFTYLNRETWNDEVEVKKVTSTIQRRVSL
tara:strand:- start:479 stop:1201 length:723 start_codon:yes stop_codon:yes gene_type:complete